MSKVLTIVASYCTTHGPNILIIAVDLEQHACEASVAQRTRSDLCWHLHRSRSYGFSFSIDNVAWS